MTLCCSTDTTIVRRSASHAVLDALRPILSVRRRSVTRSVNTAVLRCQLDVFTAQGTFSPLGD
ncbi:hypothetical protein CU668_09615 [Pseudomonas syringae pv. actinidifoliorum]|nr:hypothetical protein [Pseudomonas syringae pv. actinidifoliorum]